MNNLGICAGCSEAISPFFGIIYGRMSDGIHGMPCSGMSHNYGAFVEVNQFKNYSLIPFYGTALAINAIYAVYKEDQGALNKLGINYNLYRRINNDATLKILFISRLLIAAIPLVGTIINVALDIIAQIGL